MQRTRAARPFSQTLEPVASPIFLFFEDLPGKLLDDRINFGQALVRLQVTGEVLEHIGRIISRRLTDDPPAGVLRLADRRQSALELAVNHLRTPRHRAGSAFSLQAPANTIRLGPRSYVIAPACGARSSRSSPGPP